MTASFKRKTYHIPIETPGEDAPAPAEAPAASSVPMAEPGPEPTAEPAAAAGETAAAGDTDALDHLRRLTAEFANYRKRVEKERGETASWAQGMLLTRLLPVVDDLDRAAASLGEDASPAAQGLRLIQDKLHRILVDVGLERMDTRDQHFDPEVHEAVMSVPVGADRAGTIIGELEPGYAYKGRLLRPARVQVGVEGPEPTAP